MRDEKKIYLDHLTQDATTEAWILVGYSNLSQESVGGFRQTLKSQGATLTVAPKRLLLKALEQAGKAAQGIDAGKGPVALVHLDEQADAINIAKAVCKYEKESKNITILGAHIDGSTMTQPEVNTLSQLPSKDELRAQIVGLLTAVPSQIVGVLNAALTGVINCIDQKIKKDN